jgi:hypothetical protein
MEWINVKDRLPPAKEVLVFTGLYFAVGEYSHQEEDGSCFFI